MDKTFLSEFVYHNAKDYFEAIIDDIEKAKIEILLEFYTIEEDILGKRLFNALFEARKRNVTIRIVTDGIGSQRLSKEFVSSIRNQGIEFEFYNPLVFQANFNLKFNIFNSIKTFLKSYFMLKINKRNHRKLCLIDRKIAYLGSPNISDVHVTYTEFGPAWRDTAFRVTGSRVDFLYQAFEHTWYLLNLNSWRKVKNLISHEDIQTNYTPISRKKNLSSLKQRISLANNRVWITNPYFVPTPCIVKELLKAKKRGVDVILLLGKNCDHRFFPWINSIFYRPLIKAGIKVYLYLPEVLHSKITIIDERAISGSSNINHRSLFHDLELDLYIKNPDTLNVLTEQFHKDLLNSYQVSSKSINRVFKRMDHLIPIFSLIKSFF